MCDVVLQVVRSLHIFQSIPQDEIVVDHIVHMGQGTFRRHLVWLARWSRYSGRFSTVRVRQPDRGSAVDALAPH